MIKIIVAISRSFPGFLRSNSSKSPRRRFRYEGNFSGSRKRVEKRFQREMVQRVGRLNGGIVIKIDDAKHAVIRIIDGSDGCY